MTIEVDFNWLRELEKKSWKDHPPDSFDRRKLGWREDLEVSKADGKKALELFAKHQSELLFEPGSGVFGFGVCISAYKVIWPSFPGVPVELDRLVTLTSKQLFGRDQKHEAYKVFEGFTHTEANKKLRKEAGIEEPLRSYSYYDY